MPTYNTGALDLDEGDRPDFQTDSAGNLKVVLATAGALPTGAATSAKQDTTNTHLAQLASSTEYETVAAGSTAQALGATGAVGDTLSHIVITPATTSPGVVTVLDNATEVYAFPGGASSLTSLAPIIVPMNAKSVSGAWKVTTGANVKVAAFGNFT